MSYKIVGYTLQRLLCIHYLTCVACKRPIYREVSFKIRAQSSSTRGVIFATIFADPNVTNPFVSTGEVATAGASTGGL